ncbi:MAG: hypothetical protein HY960_13225 [Ignavibacteriae bacterium]|nr:hypothetical protein [Ignavibacteriota bacterium]
MAARDFYPGADMNVMRWWENLNTKLTNHAATLGLSGGQLTQVQTHFDAIKQKLAEVEAAKSTLRSLVAAKIQVLEEAETFIRNLVATLKLHPNFTQAIGEDLNVFGSSAPDESSIIANAKPEFQAIALATMVGLEWVKGLFDAILFERKRGNETTFTFFDKDDRSPCNDKDANLVAGVPEVRTYRAIYLKNGEPVGNWSDEVRVTVLI